MILFDDETTLTTAGLPISNRGSNYEIFLSINYTDERTGLETYRSSGRIWGSVEGVPTTTTTTTIPSILGCWIENNVGGCMLGTGIFSMSATSNAHAEQYNTNYNFHVCCSITSGTLSVNIGDSNCAEDGVISLSALTNAHAGDYGSYSNDVCLSSTSGNIDCYYAGSCSADACLASMSDTTNAHVADCNGYTRKVCCRVI